jgi:hypothetical protein
MADSSQRTSGRATSRGRTSSKSASSGKGQQSGSRPRTKSSAGSRSSNGAKSQGSSGRSAGTSRAKASTSRSQSSNSGANGASSARGNGSTRDTIIPVVSGVLSGAIGVAGGVLLGRTALQRNRKLLGLQLPTKVDFTGVGQQLGEAGRQFGKLASEVRTMREKAEQIGRALN